MALVIIEQVIFSVTLSHLLIVRPFYADIGLSLY